MKRWTPSGLYTNKEGCLNAVDWWRARGYEVRWAKVKDGYRHYRRKK